MAILKKLSRNKWFNWTVGIMGLLAIPLLIYNLYVADAVDKVFAFVELAMVLLLFGTFTALAGRDPWERRK